MLDRTLVVWMGEFGRTPKINPNAGRDHFPRVFNVALAGGGVKGGQVIGASSADGTEVKDRPVAVTDLLATLCHALKIDPTKENMSPLGRPIKIVDGGKVVGRTVRVMRDPGSKHDEPGGPGHPALGHDLAFHSTNRLEPARTHTPALPAGPRARSQPRGPLRKLDDGPDDCLLEAGGKAMRLRQLARYSLLGLITLGVILVLFGQSRNLWQSALSLPLIQTLRTGDPVERRDAAFELGLMRLRGEAGSTAVSSLIERLDDHNPDVRQSAAESLSYFENEAAPALPVLARILREGPTDLRGPAIRILTAVGSPEAHRVLDRALADPDTEVRLGVTLDFMVSVSDAAQHVPRLVEMLKSDPDSRVREAALNRLAVLDADPERLSRSELMAIRDGSAAIRKRALVLLGSTEPGPFVDAFRSALRDPDADVRDEAMVGLGRIGLKDASAVEAVCEVPAAPSNTRLPGRRSGGWAGP